MDGGTSWTEITLNYNFEEIHFSTIESGIAVQTNRIFTTINGGITWNEINNKFYTDRSFLCFYHIPDKPQICFIQHRNPLNKSNNLYYSADGGFSWKLHSLVNFPIIFMSFINENKGYISEIDMFNPFVYKVNEVAGNYSVVYKGENPVVSLQVVDSSEIYFVDGISLSKTADEFKTSRKMTFEGVEFPAPDYAISKDYGVLIDHRFKLYFYLK